MKKDTSIISNEFYSEFEELEQIILQSKQRVWQKVNYEQIYLYWYVGDYVAAKLETTQWGQQVVAGFSKFLKQRNPQLKGFDKRAIYRMIKFYNTYSEKEFVVALQPFLPDTIQKQIVAAMRPQLQKQEIEQINEIIPPFLAQISWSAHLEILTGCNNATERLFYILLAQNERLTYRELGR